MRVSFEFEIHKLIATMFTLFRPKAYILADSKLLSQQERTGLEVAFLRAYFYLKASLFLC